MALAVPGCDDSTGPAAPAEVVFAVTGDPFDLDGATGLVAVPYTVENPSEKTVYLNACPPVPAPWADRWEETRWTRYSTQPCPDPASDIPLAPGASISGEYTIDQAGEYRLGLAIRAASGGAEAWLHLTPSFEVR